jgi:hypothetical protein
MSLQDSMSICTRIFQRNMEQLRACTVNAAALLLDDAAKIDNSTHVPIIFKSDIDNCLFVTTFYGPLFLTLILKFAGILKRCRY